ncbi:DUF7134 domain-containing protein [Dactylosporangium darangshiense]|uniref:DUF7134 domain-containing protein n=1 Tax=Dactylosporangium darangshiense TaxID=579108 RepID=UPI003642BB3C
MALASTLSSSVCLSYPPPVRTLPSALICGSASGTPWLRMHCACCLPRSTVLTLAVAVGAAEPCTEATSLPSFALPFAQLVTATSSAVTNSVATGLVMALQSADTASMSSDRGRPFLDACTAVVAPQSDVESLRNPYDEVMSRFVSRPFVIDVALASVLTAATALSFASSASKLKVSFLDAEAMHRAFAVWWLFGVLIIAGLLIRRRWPLAAFALVVVGVTAHRLDSWSPPLPLDLAVPFALYSVVSQAQNGGSPSSRWGHLSRSPTA